MSRTGLTVVTALGLIVLSVALMASRWAALGTEVRGTPGDATWKVSLQVEGVLANHKASLTTVLPPDFRRQHILDESFASQSLAHSIRTNKDGGQRRAVWRPRHGPSRRKRSA